MLTKLVRAIIRKGAISLKWSDGSFSHYYPNVRSMPRGMFRKEQK